ncbi:MMPL family transporter [Streptomyces aidingensis]|uniref:Putative drug exporter of the RND superfamily n=1 Tax=Streptomyces aidingensis TaxID=910347 RepID=A0A1I1PP36_9ACTN|nr:MMPL family transporter [Streptomyces aidingensis]SFD07740.1 putative drug exporter of the RND superfamily [Streptomyces aidingensis]
MTPHHKGAPRPPAARRAGAVLLTALILLLGLAVYGAGAQDDLELSRWDSPGTDSVAVQDVLREEFGTGNPNLALLVTAAGGDVDAPRVRAAGQELAGELAAHPMVTDVRSYWATGDPALRSTDGGRALVLARLEGSATDTRAELTRLSPELARETEEITVLVTGQEEISRQVSEQARQDFLRAELLILPMVTVLLGLFLRRTVAALLTVGTGLASVLATLAGLRLLAQFTPVSVFAANLALVLGLGLGIDYSLFVIARYREERRAGAAPEAAVAATVRTAGRTVLFSGLTVAVSLATLLVFPFFFLRSFAYAGVLVTATAVAGAVLLLPAALLRWGHRVERPAPAGRPARDGLWHRAALGAMRRPLVSGGAVAAVLLIAGSPVLGLRFGLPDERTLPEGTSSREATEERNAHFAAEATDTLYVVSTRNGPFPADRTAAYADELSRLPGVFQVESPAGLHRDGELAAPPVRAADDPAGRVRLAVVPTRQAMAGGVPGGVPGLVASVREVPAPYGVLVGGYPAETTDFRAELLDRLPLVAGLILLATCGLLFLMTGSVLLPLKATVLNLLSLSVMFGALVWLFQDGNLSGPLGFTPLGAIEPSIPVLMFCVTYGLSMDYEVFLLSRITAARRAGLDTAAAVGEGVRRTAPVVTAAAGILALTFAVYASSGVVFLKMLGIGTALVILVDATLIRMVLLPVTMRLAGRANWWAPGPLRRLHARFGLDEGGPGTGRAATAGAAGGPGRARREPAGTSRGPS